MTAVRIQKVWMLGNVKHSEAVQGLGLSLSVFHFSVGIPQCFPH